MLSLLCGCVYMRLLEIKNQLKDFDANFDVQGTPELTIVFKNPVLLAKDASFLIGADPMRKTPKAVVRTWYYEFEMVRSTPIPPAPLEKMSLSLQMHSGRLVSITVPENFLQLFSREAFIETLKQAANAEILKLRKTAKASIRLSTDTDETLPNLKKALKLLGPPAEKKKDGDKMIYIYHYHIVGSDHEVQISAQMCFSKNGNLHRVHITWDTSTIDATYIHK